MDTHHMTTSGHISNRGKGLIQGSFRASRSLSPSIDSTIPVSILLALRLGDALHRNDLFVLSGIEDGYALGRPAGHANSVDRNADDLSAVGHQHDLILVADREGCD